jgi:predicted dehydrogenase
MPEKLRVALIGAGGFGGYHLRTWKEVEDARVVGVYDIAREAARKAAALHELPKAYASLEAVLADAEVDAVDVCVPNRAHAQVAIAAMEAGKHCLCEKPLAAAPAEIERMIAARDAAGRILMTAQHLRFEQRSVAFKRIIDAGRLGEIYYTRAFWLRRRMLPVTPGFLSKEQSGGGPCIDIGVHVLDLAMHLMGFPRPVAVSAISVRRLAQDAGRFNEWGPYDVEKMNVEDFAAGFIRFDNGAALSLEVSWMLNMEQRESYGVHLFGSEGGGRWPDLTFSREQDGLLIDEHITNADEGHGHRNEMQAFVRAVHADGPSPVPAEQSLTVARILEAMYRSAETGREVRL